MSRSQNFVNSWNPNITVPGVDDVQGFLQVRTLIALDSVDRSLSQNLPTGHGIIRILAIAVSTILLSRRVS